jgi:hypothetical protein
MRSIFLFKENIASIKKYSLIAGFQFSIELFILLLYYPCVQKLKGNTYMKCQRDLNL